MRSVLALFAILMLLTQIEAQQSLPQVGDAPRADLIRVEAAGQSEVLLTGEVGAVFASAQVAVRNPYTLETVNVTARPDGSFSARIAAVEGMPLQVYAARSFRPAELTAGGELSGAGAWLLSQNPAVFGVGGSLAYGSGKWLAQGRLDRPAAQAGERITLIMDVEMLLPDADLLLPYTFGAALALRPRFDERGQQLSQPSSAGWSSFLTAEGLPVLGSGLADIPFTYVTTDQVQADAERSSLRMRLPFSAALPANLPAGWYQIVITGDARIADSEPFDWYENRVFGTSGTGTAHTAEPVLPLLLRIGEPQAPRITMSLFDGLAAEDDQRAGAANLIEAQADPLIRPLNDSALAFRVLDAGRLPSALLIQAAQIRLMYAYPDQQGECLIGSNQLALIGADLLVRPAADCPQPAGYGDYRVALQGIVTAAGVPLQVASSFRFTVAERLTILPALLPGTVLAPGDAAADSVQLSPAFPAAWQVRSSLMGASAAGIANAGGIFSSGVALVPDSSGTALVDYGARYLDADGRLWAGALRAVYIRAGSSNASGAGGIADYERSAQAWFDTRVYPPDDPDAAPVANFPQFAGDLALIPDLPGAGIRPALLGGDYQIVSVVRPGLMVRQFVRAGDAVDGRVLADDLLAGQVGAGNSGLLPGDALLLFGATFGQEIAGYAASALVTDGESAQVVPAFSAPISTQQDQPAYMLLLPTSGGAGQVYAAGDLLRPAGYLLPAVAGQITMTMTAPDQRVIVRELSAGRYGYFADDEGITLEQAGMYQITLDAIYAGSVSTGLLSRPVTTRISYPVFVLEPDAPLLETTRTPTSDVTAGQAFTINVRLPADWSDVAGFVVARTPQQILEISPLSIFSNQTNYTFDWVRAARQFPNLETQADQPADVDEITIVLAMTGKDPQGISRIRTRIFTLRAGQLITVSGE